MDCRRFRKVVFLYTDNEMEADLVIDFRQHLTLCPHCAQHIEYTLRLLSLVRKRCQRVAAPESLRDRILTSLPHRQSVTEKFRD